MIRWNVVAAGTMQEDRKERSEPTSRSFATIVDGQNSGKGARTIRVSWRLQVLGEERRIAQLLFGTSGAGMRIEAAGNVVEISM